MIEMGNDRETIESNLENNKHNNITTTYELLLKKHIQTQFLKKSVNALTKTKNSQNTPQQVNLQISNPNNPNNSNRGNDKFSKKRTESNGDKDININIINYAAKKIGNININISNPQQCSHQNNTNNSINSNNNSHSIGSVF